MLTHCAAPPARHLHGGSTETPATPRGGVTSAPYGSLGLMSVGADGENPRDYGTRTRN